MCPDWMFGLSKRWKVACGLISDNTQYNKQYYLKKINKDLMCPTWMFS